ncbi:MAG: DUF6932 family protein [Candidatus Methanospirareceae archaeon]
MSSLPIFTADGVLPPGDYVLGLQDLRESMLVEDNLELCGPNWDRKWREKLLDNLSVLVKQLWSVGVVEIFVDGSFVEDKEHPNDIDGYFCCDFRRYVTGDLARDLNLLDPYKVWDWSPESRRPYSGYPKLQLPMWHFYRVELYPHWGQGSGIRDEHGNEQTFPAAFRRSRCDGVPKGIVKIGGE